MFRKIAAVVAVISACSWSVQASDLFEYGRKLPTQRDDVFSLNAGTAFNVNALVQAPGGGDGSTDYLEMSGPGLAVGFSYEYIAWLVSVQIDATFVNISGEQTANTALFLDSGDSVDFNGASYDYMYIPAGTPFETSLMGGSMDMNLLMHPLVINFTDRFSVVPSFVAGVLLFGGDQTIDAGDPTTVVHSPEQGRDYVAGGEGGGLVGMAAPQIGPACEFRIGDKDALNQVLKLHWLFFGLLGDEMDHTNLRLSYRAEFPLESYENTLFFGLDLRAFESSGTEDVGGTDMDTYNFAMNTVMLTFGITY